MFPELLLRPLLAEYNRQLCLDPGRLDRLRALSGRCVEVGPGWGNVRLEVAPDGTLIPGQGEPVAVLQVSLALLPRLLAADPGVYREIRIEGDATFGAHFARALADMPPDPVETLSELVGDVAAQRLGQAAAALVSEPAQMAERFAENLAEYCQEEAGVLPGRLAMNDWLQGVDRLRDDLARLEKRIALLEAKRNQ